MKSEKELFKIFCPYKEVFIENVSSELLEKIGGLPLLLLLQTSQNVTIDEIAEGTCIQTWVINDVAEELVQNGLFYKDDDQGYKLTKIGESYVRIQDFIKKFQADQKQRYAVNLFTCQLEKVSNEQYFANTKRPADHVPYLPNKLRNAVQLVTTPNYENTLGYMKQYFDLTEVALTDDDYEYIQFQLRTKGEVFYVPYYVPEDAYFNNSAASEKNTENDVAFPHIIELNVPLNRVKRVYEYTAVSSEIRDALLKLNYDAKECLSEIGKEHIRKIIQADKYTFICREQVFDAYSGREYSFEDSSAETSDSTRNNRAFVLSERYFIPMERKQAIKSDDQLYYHYEVKEKLLLI